MKKLYTGFKSTILIYLLMSNSGNMSLTCTRMFTPLGSFRVPDTLAIYRSSETIVYINHITSPFKTPSTNLKTPFILHFLRLFPQRRLELRHATSPCQHIFDLATTQNHKRYTRNKYIQDKSPLSPYPRFLLWYKCPF